MTNPTPPGRVPDAIDVLRAHAENEALRAQQDDAYDHGPQAETVEEAARDVGKWLNERPNRPLDLRHVAMLTHHAKPAAHVQNPAEIEHVAGDVSKNGAEVNTSTQQPAPATQQAREVEGWLTWFRTPSGGREPNYSHGAKKPTHGTELDAVLTKYPVYAEPRPSPAAQAAGSVPAVSDLPPLPDPDLRDVGTKPQDVKDFLNGYATAYARLALAARAQAESAPVVLGDDELVRLGKSPESGLHPWGAGTTRADYLRALRAVLAAARAPAESVLEDAALPMQPICITSDGVIRFKQNRMVNDVYEFSQLRGFGLSEMARRDYTQEERMQFAQLIGYSVSGYGGLSYASPESVKKADAIADSLIAARKQGANHDNH